MNKIKIEQKNESKNETNINTKLYCGAILKKIKTEILQGVNNFFSTRKDGSKLVKSYENVAEV